jgi:peroxiredoxin Q/BCP
LSQLLVSILQGKSTDDERNSTTQVCLFRDGYPTLTSTGYTIYGLSADSPKANTTFHTKQKLTYPLLCNPSLTLIKAIGLSEAGKTKRGVFAVEKKTGRVVVALKGGPQQTVDAVKKIVDAAVETEGEKRLSGDKVAAETADEVADAAKEAKLDVTPAVGTPTAA